MPGTTSEATHNRVTDEQRLVERMTFAVRLIGDSVEIDPQVRSGVPVLRGTRFPASQVIAELAAGRNVAEIASEWELDEKVVRGFLEGLSIQLDHPLRP